MKTQISSLRCGKKNQILNTEIDYPKISGSNHSDVESVWNRVTEENPNSIKILVKGIEIELDSDWSISRKSVSYWGNISKKDLEDKFCLKAAKKETPSISIQNGNVVIVSNGKNSYSYICPSLIKIL